MDDGGPKKPKQSGTITFLPFTDILKRERREMLVPDLLFNAGVTTLVGQSGNGKSTLCMAIAPQTMIGGRWGDQLIKPRPVIWVAGEGQDDVRPMLEAWMKENPNANLDVLDHYFIEEPIDFSSDAETDFLIDGIKGMPPTLIITDALADMIGDLKEDSSHDINQVYRNFWRVVHANRASFLIPHHAGWEGERERGSTAIRAKSDIVVKIDELELSISGSEHMTLTHLKRRGGAKRKEFPFSMKLVPVPGYPEPVPIVTGPTNTFDIVMKMPIDALDKNVNELAELMAREGLENISWTALLEKSGMSRTTFKRVIKAAVGSGVIIADEARGNRKDKYGYNLSENFKAQNLGPDFGSKGPPLKRGGPFGPNFSPGPLGPLDPIGPLAPTPGCENADTTATMKSLENSPPAQPTNVEGSELIKEAMEDMDKETKAKAKPSKLR